jgi:hypothetical protein
MMKTSLPSQQSSKGQVRNLDLLPMIQMIILMISIVPSVLQLEPLTSEAVSTSGAIYPKTSQSLPQRHSSSPRYFILMFLAMEKYVSILSRKIGNQISDSNTSSLPSNVS